MKNGEQPAMQCGRLWAAEIVQVAPMAIVAIATAAVAGMGANKAIGVPANAAGTGLMAPVALHPVPRCRRRKNCSINSTRTRTTR